MAEQVPHPAVGHFGRDGMRRLVLSSLGAAVDDGVRALLEQVGVPLLVTPYFTAAAETDGLTLGVFAGHHGRHAQEAQAAWARVGTDGLAEMAVSTDGTVHAVFLGGVAPDMFVSSSLDVFLQSLAVLDRYLGVIAGSRDLADGAAAFRDLNSELRRTDPAAFEDRESWWPRVLDDVRHTLNIGFSAAFEYTDEQGKRQVVTEATGPGRPHPEELIWQRLKAQGIAPDRVTRVYCELEACMMPGHYCAVWMARQFPAAQFTHAFDYGQSAESREEGLKALIRFTAEQARR
ncbi:nucleic acid/nucleotide deaminase domain-containing protein [Streptomyces hydrogenans]|uniref:nucleic acid/nucleotide deaminase domain-containing protein n=1 Tax=Streptomyces hydrogenans TaxID=1873719 RepID=UPI0036576F59